MKLKKSFFIFTLLAFGALKLNAQTGIGTTTPNASAKLDVYSTNKGFLPPRVTLTSATDATTIASPAEGLLVYNLGSVGLQAGYYYWNGANWATIATATSAGNGVTSMDMVKLYGEAWSSATNKIGNANGYSFTVPVSGRYLFDFTSTGYGNAYFTFKVRQGNTVLAVDSQYSYNNSVHVEYNGKVELNLQAGNTYNVYVFSSGSRDGGDFDRVYYKMVAGNLPVTGQTVDYGIARYTSADGGSLTTGAIVGFDAAAGGNLNWSGNKFTLKANKTYELESYLAIYQSVGWVAGKFQIFDYTNNVALANGLYMSMQGAETYNPNANGLMRAIITPAGDIQVGVKFVSFSGAAYAPGLIGSANTVTSAAPNQCYFLAKQIGSSAIINPWTLSGTSTYNTTGNVGIGNNAPAATLDVTGSLAVSGATTFKDIVEIGTGIGDEGGEFHFAIPATNTTLQNRVNVDVWQNKLRFFEGSNNAKGVYIDLNKAPNGVGGEISYKASGIVNRGVDVTLGNLKARVAASGNASLQLSTVSGTYSIYGSGVHVFTSNLGSTTIDGASPKTISTTPVYLLAGNTFPTAGGTDTWNIMDTSNSIAWRITMILGAGVNNNLITIERLY